MTTGNYNSVLLCIRDRATDIYINGLPIGISAERFTRHALVLPGGRRTEVDIDKWVIEEAINHLTAVRDSL